MPTHIIKLSEEGKDFYLLWYTNVDAPITYGMSLEEFKVFYKKEYGVQEMKKLPQRLKRVERTGCSSRLENIDDLLIDNRAGKNETEITKTEIFKKYCLEKQC